ncbi:Rap1a/Tai family immunity protein [Methylobacterium hispanicum]|uniref:Rap1a/Tai family immunity protein n=1 Tax=Methylobacterium hispanicum TaxID=270350 RepID=UPI002F351B4F
MSRRNSSKTSLRPILGGIALLGILIVPVQAASEGEASADIIDGCNQFIKFSRKGTPPRDADKLRRLGECIGAVRTTLAFLVRDDAVCPPSHAKLVDAVNIFSLHVLRHPDGLRENYVVVIQRALVAAWPCRPSKSL